MDLVGPKIEGTGLNLLENETRQAELSNRKMKVGTRPNPAHLKQPGSYRSTGPSSLLCFLLTCSK